MGESWAHSMEGVGPEGPRRKAARRSALRCKAAQCDGGCTRSAHAPAAGDGEGPGGPRRRVAEQCVAKRGAAKRGRAGGGQQPTRQPELCVGLWGPEGPPVRCSAERRAAVRCGERRCGAALIAPAWLVRLQQVMGDGARRPPVRCGAQLSAAIQREAPRWPGAYALRMPSHQSPSSCGADLPARFSIRSCRCAP